MAQKYTLEQQFEHNFARLFKGSKILVALSGGVDSMVLFDLLLKTKVRIEVLHCNFGLRGAESEGDEALVVEICTQQKVPCHIKRFMHADFEGSDSIQMVARRLRYAWFNDCLAVDPDSQLAMAHHRADLVETFLHRIIKGSGVGALASIPEQRGQLIRPLLGVSKAEILAYAHTYGIKYREDSSNLSNKYERNQIRNQLMPLLSGINPSVEASMASHVQQFVDLKAYFETLIPLYFDGRTLSFAKMPETLKKPFFIFEIFRKYGFNLSQALDIAKAIETPKNQHFHTEVFTLYFQPDQAIIVKKESNTPLVFYVHEDTKTLDIGHSTLKFSLVPNANTFDFKNQAHCYLDFEKLTFPLSIRPWTAADSFRPFGFKGKKSLSKFLTDLKLDPSAKKNQMLLCSENTVVWVLGHRIAAGFEVTDSTTNVFSVEMSFSKSL